MSERIHSTAPQNTVPQNSAPAVASASTTQTAGKWITLAAGSAVLFLVGGAAFQWLRPTPAVSATGREGTARASAKDQIVARLNGEAVTYEQVARECYQRYGAEVLDNILNRMLIEQECQKQGVVVSPEDINQEITEIAKRFGIPVDTYLQMLEGERNLTPEQYKTDVIGPMLALRKLAGEEAKPTEEEIKQSFIKLYGPRVEARMILVEGNIRQANAIWEEARKNPEGFEELAKTKSMDPNSRPLGGRIPPIPKHAGNPALEEAAFKLKAGEVSGVIQLTENRYCILKCEGRTKPLVEDIREVYNDLYKQVREEKTQMMVSQVFEKIRSEANIENMLIGTATRARPTTKGAVNVTPTAGKKTAKTKAPARGETF